MFGNLFNDSMTDKKVDNNTAKTVDGQIIEQPPNSRESRNLIGIKNQGATCYLNSLLQTLFLTPEFREALFKLGPEELGKIYDKDKNAKVRVIPLQLQHLFARLLLIDQDACTTKELTDSFGWQNSEQFQQHDVQELSRILFDALETSLVGTSGSDLIQNLFKGNIVNQIKCCVCDRVSETKEEFLDITVSVVSENSLEKSLSNVYESQELMSGKNQYFCEQCNQLVNAQKGAKLESCPPILTLSLLRFNYDMKTFSRYKETGHFAFPVKLDIAKYCKDHDTSVSTEYTLYSVIIHKGSAHRGHYHAYIRDVDGLGHSEIPVADCDYEPNFSFVPNHNLQQLPRKCDKIEEEIGPEELLACLMSVRGAIRISELGRILHEETGITWSKKFRKQYGTMLKFIRSCTQTFVLDSKEQTVSLCDSSRSTPFSTRPPLDTVPEESTQDCTKALNGENLPSPIPNGNDFTFSNDNNETYHDCTDVIANGDLHRIGASWFNVNDELIKPISVHSIPDQFSGQQSAYMLFYRRKDLQRPKECWGDRSHRIPQHISNIITKENERLSLWRTTYEEAVNRLDLHIHIEQTCCFQNQLILPNDPSGCLIHIDRRENISTLVTNINDCIRKILRRKRKQRLKVYHDLTEQTFQKQDEQYSHLHTIKVLPHGGIHLYDCVSEEKTITLKDAKLESDMHLFFWNGKSIFRKEVSCGYDWESVAVVLQCTLSETCHCKFKFAIKHDICLETVKFYASKFLHVGIEEITVEWKTNIVDEEGLSNDVYINLNEVSGETLQYEEMFRAKVKSLTEKCETPQTCGEEKETNIHLKVQNTILKCDEEVLKDAIYTFDASIEMTIEDLKVFIAKTLLITQSSEKFRLSLLCNDEKVPMQENLTLSSYEISENDLLVLEDFRAPSMNQIVLFVKPLLENVFVEVIVDQTLDMFQLVKIVEKQLDMKDNEWHLCRSNCYGEKVTVLNKFDETIVMLGIANGTYLMVCPGKLLKDGMISIKLWWYPPPEMLCDLVTNNEISYIYDSITTKSNTSLNNSLPLLGLRKWKSVDNIDCLAMILGPLEMGNVEVSKDGNLFDLNLAIRNALPENFIWTGKPMRIRTVEKSVLSRILPTQPEMTLKRLKIQNSTQLAVQFSDEELSKDQVALNIVFHVPGTRLYTQPAELICNCNPSQVIQELSKILGIPHSNIKVAKKDCEGNSWKILQMENVARNKHKKKGGKSNAKRKSTVKSNKDVSISLKDSDIIGVKILSEEEKRFTEDIGLDDFDTDDDIQKRKFKDKDQKVIASNKYSFLSGKDTGKITERKSQKNKEAPLKIHVQNFGDGESSLDELPCSEH
uniref:Ubiquitin carboxyl-terminal hydrolase 40 n=1 Tax=Phallusia mammillata TaxID=59560 RepID=A0A6F9DX25_9ASCI|nr:ubiquitin carboxyl-terminal hydrolase 40 [Phallusia mammillata]